MREALFGFTVFLCYFFGLISGSVLLKPFSLYFTDLPAKFALVVNNSGVCGALHVADPLDACSSLRNDMTSNITEKMRFALIVRGGCTFEEKIRNAQNGGFRAAIVFDDRDKENLLYMMVNPEGIRIHAVFVLKAAGEILKQLARGQEGECCIYPSHNGTTWTVLAISFISLVVVLALLVIAFVVPRNWLYWQRINHYYSRSLDTKMVEALPCFDFSSARLSDCRNGETCPICLEDYQDGEILKGLPCQHDFHSSCVDSWLTKWGTFCPVCKHDMRTKITYSEINNMVRTNENLSFPNSSGMFCKCRMALTFADQEKNTIYICQQFTINDKDLILSPVTNILLCSQLDRAPGQERNCLAFEIGYGVYQIIMPSCLFFMLKGGLESVNICLGVLAILGSPNN